MEQYLNTTRSKRYQAPKLPKSIIGVLLAWAVTSPLLALETRTWGVASDREAGIAYRHPPQLLPRSYTGNVVQARGFYAMAMAAKAGKKGKNRIPQVQTVGHRQWPEGTDISKAMGDFLGKKSTISDGPDWQGTGVPWTKGVGKKGDRALLLTLPSGHLVGVYCSGAIEDVKAQAVFESIEILDEKDPLTKRNQDNDRGMIENTAGDLVSIGRAARSRDRSIRKGLQIDYAD